MIGKPGKPVHEITSYRPISLLPVTSKVCEKVLLQRLMKELRKRSIIPDHQFGFRQDHGTVEQVHRVCRTIRDALEHKEYCSSAFLDVQQAFDKVWHTGLLFKIKSLLPHTFFGLLKSYLTDRKEGVCHKAQCLVLCSIQFTQMTKYHKLITSLWLPLRMILMFLLAVEVLTMLQQSYNIV
ncbi:unnamed protein product [Parnassius mnemosyne]|uniref:Reverse transcriptase domain-containing protein n=1 Tax=Parnassius mnemosyne TaxID=213953 RepID=A0AAV1K8W2_9NEOP